MNTLKHTITSLAVASAAVLPASVPQISNVTMAQDDGRRVTVTYTLSDAPAVVTLDVQTNAVADAAADDSGWTSIGGEAVWNAMGDVWRKVEVGEKTITWRPDHTWPDHKIDGNRVRAVVTAWATNNTPDYMVVDLTGVPAEDVVRYYPGVEFLPKKNFAQTGAAVTNNPDYKTTKLLMRKIMARGVEWAMGAPKSVEMTQDSGDYSETNETPHLAVLDSNYYIGVFEVTQRQYAYIVGAMQSFIFTGDMLPADGKGFDYGRLRLFPATTASGTYPTSSDITGYSWPNAPHPESALGLLRLKTGLDFDLPSHAQWEFACRAGNGFGCWGDGSKVLNKSVDANLAKQAHYLGNATEESPVIVGSYHPNSWGLYDMHGNMIELCLDYNEGGLSTAKDVSGKLYAGRVNIDPDDPTKSLSHNNSISGTHIVKGGCYTARAGRCRASFINGKFPHFGPSPTEGMGVANARDVGFRLVCTAGLE